MLGTKNQKWKGGGKSLSWEVKSKTLKDISSSNKEVEKIHPSIYILCQSTQKKEKELSKVWSCHKKGLGYRMSIS